VQQRPLVFASPEDDMAATAAVATVGSRHGIEFRLHKMLAAGAAMPAPAKDPDLVDKV